MAVEVVSVHFPKAGGTSLLRTFQRAYGAAAVQTDYGADPADPCSPWNLDPDGFLDRARRQLVPHGVRVVHGHFPLAKHLHHPGARRVVFLRHPVAALVSIYYYWQTITTGHALSDYWRANRLDLVESARLPALRRLLSQTYLGGASIDDFDFVGAMDHYAEDVQRLARLLGRPLREVQENRNTARGYREEARRVFADPGLLRTLTDLLADDIAAYDRGMARRRQIIGAAA